MNNHRTKLLVISVLCLWSFLGSHALFSQNTKTYSERSHTPNQDLRAMAAKFKKRAIANKSEAVKKARAHGWKVTEELPGGGYRELQKVGPGGTPIYKESFNEVVVKGNRTNFLSKDFSDHFGVDGTGMTIGIWDGGKALPDHQEFDERFSVGDNARRVSGHATHVLGTAIASGVDPQAKGVAFNANGQSFDWNQDEGEAAEAAANGLLISNHSYGLSGRNLPDWYFGSYVNQAQDWDEIMHAAPYYLMVTAAGNSQHLEYNDEPLTGTATDGYDLLLGFALSKNGLTVAAADQLEVNANGELLSADIAYFSNFGPADDGRIKPDITGAGVNVYSAYDEGEDSYKTLSGTSMASPGVAASLLLLQQYYHIAFGDYMKAATLKGLVLHTADEAGDFPGPDARFGWGIINSKRAAETIDAVDVNTRIDEDQLANGEEFAMNITAREGETLSVSISWTDPAYSGKIHGRVNDSTRVLMNDLDVRVIRGDEVYYPWRLSLSDIRGGAKKGDNKVDPFEKIEIENASGEYKIVVSHKGDLVNISQDFSLIVTGVTESGCSTVVPSNTIVEDVLMNEAVVSWNEEKDAYYEVRYKKSSDDNWLSKMVDENRIALSSLEENTEYTLEVRTVCTALMGSEYAEAVVFTTKPSDNNTDDPVDNPGDTPIDDPVDNPVDNPGDTPVDNPGDNPANDPEEVVPEVPEIGDAPNPDESLGEIVREEDPSDVSWGDNDDYYGAINDPESVPEEDIVIVKSNESQTISLSGNTEGLGAYFMTDAVGRIIAEGQDASGPISIASFSSGMYILVYEKGTERAFKKFIK